MCSRKEFTGGGCNVRKTFRLDATRGADRLERVERGEVSALSMASKDRTRIEVQVVVESRERRRGQGITACTCSSDLACINAREDGAPEWCMSSAQNMNAALEQQGDGTKEVSKQVRTTLKARYAARKKDRFRPRPWH